MKTVSVFESRKAVVIFAAFLQCFWLLFPDVSRAHPHPPGPGPTPNPTATPGPRLDPATLEKFVDALPKPRVERPDHKDNGEPFYVMEMTQFKQRLHRDLPKTTVWGFNGSYPGPTIEALKDRPVRVLWKNELPKRHLLPVDPTLDEVAGNPEVRTVVHLHGGHTAAEFDGNPQAWYSRDWRVRGPTFTAKVYRYDNDQTSATLWYHDHAVGITRLNVYAGLAGFYLLRDIPEKALPLPRGDFELPIAIQDRSFNRDGSLFYPGPTIGGVSPSVVPEFFGDTVVVNGKIWPYKEVEPKKYRLRLLDGSNTRSYSLRLFEYDERTKQADFGRPGPSFVQIGTDGGLLPAPVTVPEELVLAPGERADVIVDFSAFAGKSLLLHNGSDETPLLPEVLLFRVKNTAGGTGDAAVIPERLTKLKPLSPPVLTRTHVLTEGSDIYGRPLLLINNKGFEEAVSEKPRLGATEIWRFVNTTVDTHPMHIHLVQFRILDRQPFDLEEFERSRTLVFTGPPVPPDPNEDGQKDTVRSPPGYVTRVIANFDRLGRYVFHCHILEHEDHDMMRPFEVIPVVAPETRMTSAKL